MIGLCCQKQSIVQISFPFHFIHFTLALFQWKFKQVLFFGTNISTYSRKFLDTVFQAGLETTLKVFWFKILKEQETFKRGGSSKNYVYWALASVWLLSLCTRSWFHLCFQNNIGCSHNSKAIITNQIKKSNSVITVLYISFKHYIIVLFAYQ